MYKNLSQAQNITKQKKKQYKPTESWKRSREGERGTQRGRAGYIFKISNYFRAVLLGVLLFIFRCSIVIA